MLNPIYLVRHGTTEAIEKGLMQGSSDSPLSSRGCKEALLTAKALEKTGAFRVFSSPMGRAVETTEIICRHLHLTYQLINNLREMDFGYWEGKAYFDAPDQNSDIFERLGLLARILFAQITGESLRSVSSRARSAWKEIMSLIHNEAILVISHGALINYLLKYLLSSRDFDRIKPVQTRPCSISELHFQKTRHAKIIRINDFRHLE